MSKQNKIAFENLRAEMGRKKLTIGNIADSIGMDRGTLGRKLSRSCPLKLDEAFEIIRTCFPNEQIEYIFKEANLNKSSEQKQAG